MVEIKVDDKKIYIKMNGDGSVDLENIYNSKFFYTFGIKMVERKQGGAVKPKIEDTAVATVRKIEDNVEDVVHGVLSNPINPNEQPDVEPEPKLKPISIEIVLEREGKYDTFNNYIDALNKNKTLNPLSTFKGTGMDCITLEHITDDLSICLDYFKSNGAQMLIKKKEDIFFINGRFVFLCGSLSKYDKKNLPNEESVIKILDEICGFEYVKGEDYFQGLISGTFLYNKIENLLKGGGLGGNHGFPRP
jgi:hypothetical protein